MNGKNKLPIFLLVTYLFLSLMPVLSSGYYSDDMVNSLLKGKLQLANKSILEEIKETTIGWPQYGSRLTPVASVVTTLIYYYAHNLIIYKLTIVLLVILNILLFAYFLYIVSGTKSLAIVSASIIPLMIQFRLYHDPILSFGGLLQVLCILLLLSLTLLQKFLSSHRNTYYIFSLITYNLSLYYYDITLPFVIMHVILIATHYGYTQRGKIFKLSYPFLISLTIYLMPRIAVMYMHSNSSSPYSGTSPNLDLLLIFKTFLLQIFSTLPLSYYIGNPNQIFKHNLSFILGHQIHIIDFITSILASVIVFNAITKITAKTTKINFKLFSLLGLVLIFSPAILISISTKYQTELNSFGIGMGYLPVYIQYYGLSMLIAPLIVAIFRQLESNVLRIFTQLVITMAIMCICIVNSMANIIVIDQANIALHFRRTTLERAFQANQVLGYIPEHASLLIIDNYSYDPYPKAVNHHLEVWAKYYKWISSELLYLASSQRFTVFATIKDLKIKTAADADKRDYQKEDFYFIKICSFPINNTSTNKDGYVDVYKINRILFNNMDLEKSHIDTAPVFYGSR